MANMVMNESKSFEFTYSAKQQQEIDNIRKKYLPKKEDKMETLRRLDREAERPGTVTALVVGITILSVAYPLYKKITKKQRAQIAEQILALSEEISL